MSLEKREFRAKGAHRLSYRRPAENWREALPLGNGSLGCMVFGGASEQLSLNYDQLWTGVPGTPAVADNRAALAAAKAAVDRRDYAEAERCITEGFQTCSSDSYEPMGDLFLTLDGGEEVSEFYRELSLERAVHTVTFRKGDVLHRRETFVSYPSGALCLLWEASAPFTVKASLTSKLRHTVSHREGALLLLGECRSASLINRQRHPEITPSEYDERESEAWIRVG